MGNLILPPIESITSLISSLMPQLEFYDWIDITIATNADGSGEWGYQTGDNTLDGQAHFYDHWAVGIIDGDTDPAELARFLRSQLGITIRNNT